MSEDTTLNYRGRKASRARSEQRRRAILEASLRIVVADGVRGIRHRAVAKEANVPLSATTYYFKDISDLIADTFILFAENAMNDVLDPIYKNVGEFIGEHKAYVGSSTETNNRVVEALAMMIVAFLKHELTEKRDHMIAEQAFKHECLRDSRLREVAKAYFEYLMSEMTELCRVIGVADPDIAGELLIGTLDRLEHEALMVPVEEFDEQRANKIMQRQLRAFL
ncbi:TetR family transcriptional regulator [Ketobacter sp. MCCC 1A13808]|uniref:TetR/AcrR family transcriptional regulator n=1 Tax=Ketobacter sp. MCCC 1A13808 TaxID=2602738 RepID=UPI000F25D1A1|nr:TetR family transcriptional regulator [Ketobacter sp. MCCC 1A13808]MVF14705.1 TetR family transcriptional regulator [Ketobacter sp. MCCC 1A13808]RLP53929.1 MAG: TetR family transcriptional regulator [Ketobacter sp.]